ncbi:MAG: endolytic transglycosylase MltG [Clostridia bacterium]|nr:endolytic transglycosylase MltG [Clostridia bacterium]MDD4049167.1 endolytic transglycosylase MltG [Clostridia bacterium]
MNPILNKSIKKVRRAPRLFVIIFLIVMAFCAVIYGQLGAVTSDEGKDKMFLVEYGSTPGQIANSLAEKGFIKNVRAFILYARITGNIKNFKAGEYIINPALNVPQIVDKLIKGEIISITFTIPEGYDLRQIVKVLVKNDIATEEEFWEAVKNGDFDYSFLKDLPHNDNRLEGYLFPDTYTIAKGISVDQVINMMLKRFENIYKKLPENKTGLSQHEVVTLASMIEGESLLDKERAVVASVFFNRLKIGMKLDSCATVQYALKERKTRLLFEDLEIKSPYNTYLNKGLPPGPIGNPGIASLCAALEPVDTNYYYFFAKKDNSGEHVFSTTLGEHNRSKKLGGY